MEGIKTLSSLLIKIFPNIKELLPSFNYIFTNYHSSLIKSINPQCTNILNNLTLQEQADINFLKLLEDIEEKTNITKNILALDPLLSKNNVFYLKKIIDSEPITDPQRHCNYFISSNSSKAISEELILIQKCVRNAIKRLDFKLIKYKLQ